MASLYADALVDILDDAIVFKHYYFPFISKRIALSEIAEVLVEQPTLRNGRWRLWGTGTLGTWFPIDWRRPMRNAIFLLRLHDRRTRVGFTVEDSQRVRGILRQKGLLRG